MDPAPLPGGACEHSGDGSLQTLVGVGDDEGRPAEAPSHQGAEEGSPEGVVLARPDVDTEDLAPTVRGHPHGDDRGHGDDPALKGPETQFHQAVAR